MLEGSVAGVEGGRRGEHETKADICRDQAMPGLAGPVRTVALTLGELQDDWRGLSGRLTLDPWLRIFYSGVRGEAERPMKRLQKFRSKMFQALTTMC